MRTLAALAVPGTWTHPGGVLVGRTVANAALLEALLEHGSFERVLMVAGEDADLPPLEALTGAWKLPPGRLGAAHVFQLPALLRGGAIDVLHHPAHVERLFDLVALRDRYATKATPVTGQTHSLSYPRLHQELARWPLLAPSPTDAIFCSSTVGRRTLEVCFDDVEAAFRARGLATPLPRWNLPHVPLGVDVEALTPLPRADAKQALGLPAGRVVLLTLARFTEYDKLDAFPLLQVFASLVHDEQLDVHLVLAGARQGTKTPEMLSLWAKVLKVEDRVTLKVDFADAEKRTLLSAADVFVSPVDNLQETFGQSVVEALAAGLPVVASDFDGYKDTVDDEVGRRVTTRLGVDWGPLSELGPLLYERPLHLVLGQSVEVDLGHLRQTLSELVRDASLRERLGKAARARATARYDWKVVVRQLEATWRDLAARAFTPAATPHPLRLDFAGAFGHFPTEAAMNPARRLARTAFSRAPGQSWVIYPELGTLLSDDDVRRALAFCEAPRPWSELVAHLGSSLGHREPWVASFIATWLVKHGLLE
ncbi:MAG: glycosyltransferase family 4 protein [Myxococcus sp.]|nr:glycosyltransferase family 4 protein [Myxococcus sp.]